MKYNFSLRKCNRNRFQCWLSLPSMCAMWYVVVRRSNSRVQINRVDARRSSYSLVYVVIVFLWKIYNLDQAASEFFENLSFRGFCIVVILLTVVGLRNHTLYRRLNDIGCDEIAWFFRWHRVFGFDGIVVALIVRSFDRCVTVVLRGVSIVVVIKCVINISATFWVVVNENKDKYWRREGEVECQRGLITDAFAVAGTHDFRLVAFAIVFQASGTLAIAAFGMTSQSVALITCFPYFWPING